MTTEQDEKTQGFIQVNQVLNAKPQLGPVPGEQVIPWIIIITVSYLLCVGILGLGWIGFILVSGWGIGTWWVLTGNESWRFLSKFQGVPRWTRGHLPYASLLEADIEASANSRNSRNSRKTRQTPRRKSRSSTRILVKR